MDKINPLSFITDTDPIAQAIQDVSGWYKTEYMTFDTGSSTAVNSIQWYMAQGWTIDSTEPYTTGAGTSTTTTHTRYTFSRRKLQSELVLQDMVTDFTKSYNEGRDINDQRYDEIVAIWNVALDKTEDEINALGTDSDSYDLIIQGILDQMPTDLSDFEDDLDGIMDDYGDSRRTAINVRFDAELASASQSLIDSGLKTTVLWTTQSAGIEREREQALTDFEDTYIEREVAIALALMKARTDIRVALLSANDRWMKFRQDNKFTPLQLRNRTLELMLAFMERRTDSYPGLENLSGMAMQLGYSDGAATVSPS